MLRWKGYLTAETILSGLDGSLLKGINLFQSRWLDQTLLS